MAVEDEGAQDVREGMNVWTCKIGECAPRDLPAGADYPMRRAIAAAYRSLTGHDPDFIFSGWGGELTVSERAVHENRVPDPDAIIAEARRTIDRATEMIDGAVRAKAARVEAPGDGLTHIPRPSSPGADLIANERLRQMYAEFWTPEHDDEHDGGELRRAAQCYVTYAGRSPMAMAPPAWPWESSSWKPSGDPVRDLVKAGALIAAEIDRLQRATSREQER